MAQNIANGNVHFNYAGPLNTFSLSFTTGAQRGSQAMGIPQLTWCYGTGTSSGARNQPGS